MKNLASAHMETPSPGWRDYWQLMRFDRPIGTLLLLWPTLWSLWIAGSGHPDPVLIVIFVVGVTLMRAAGCVINDYADRNFDGAVERTQHRPMAQKRVSPRQALSLFTILVLISFILVLFTNVLTIALSVPALLLAACYPFAKRHTHLPQLVLGAAFSWGIPMAFAAQRGYLDSAIWLLFVAAVIWTVIYDTFYAMVDREDDLKIGIKSTAILFGEADRAITAILQVLFIFAMKLVGERFDLGWIYESSLVVVLALFVYQQYLIQFRERKACFTAFLNNNWVGGVIFAGILADFYWLW